jgi:uncharacterized protein (TIGR02246 family)
MRTLAAVAVLLLVAACQAPPAEMNEAEIAQIEAEVRQELNDLISEFADAMLRGDAEAVMSLFGPDVRVYWPGFGMNLTREEIQDVMEETLQTATFTRFEAKLVELWVNGHAAFTIHDVSESFQAEGQEPESASSICFSRFENQDGVWKFDRDVCAPKDAPPEG